MRSLALAPFLLFSASAYALEKDAPAPHIAVSLASQLNPSSPLAVLSGAFPLPSSGDQGPPVIRIPPAWSFSIGWVADTFTDANSSFVDLIYWATLGDGTTALPPWLEFDNTTLTFYGVTPDDSEQRTSGSDDTPAQNNNYTISFYSALDPYASPPSNNTNSSASFASTDFIIEISRNQLALVAPPPVVPTVATSLVAYDLHPWLTSSLFYARQEQNNSTVGLRVTVDPGNENWLTWNSSSLVLSGQVPAVETLGRTVDLSLNIVDTSGTSTTYTSLTVRILPYPFTVTSLPNITASEASDSTFHASLAQYINPSSGVSNYTIEGPNATWVQVDEHDSTIRGTVPRGGTPPVEDPLEFSFTASVAPNLTVTLPFYLELVAADDHAAAAQASVPAKFHTFLPLLVVLPLVLFLAGSLVWWRLRVRRNRREMDGDGFTFERKALPPSPVEFDGKPIVLVRQYSEMEKPPSLTSSPMFDDAYDDSSFKSYDSKASSSPAAYSIRRVEPARLSKSRSIIDISPTFSLPTVHEDEDEDQAGSVNDRRRGRGGRASVASNGMNEMGQMPSMNFGFLLSPAPRHGPADVPVTPSIRDSAQNSPSLLSTPLSDAAAARSVNSAFSSLPSWDSESTWHYERRRRPPSPVWRKDERDQGLTLWDKMKEQARVVSKGSAR